MTRDDAYHLATYAAADGTPRPGLIVDDTVIDLSGISSATPASVLSILGHWESLKPRLAQHARAARAGGSAPRLPLAQVRLLPPILYPGTVFCAGANYKDHVREMSKALGLPEEPDPHELGLKPWHFLKSSASCIRGTGERIVLPAYSRKVDWEAEIALVIGRPCRDVSVDDAMSFVAGLTIVNDLSARDHLKRPQVPPNSPFHFDWVSQKCFDGSLPMGPWITPLEQAGDPGNLGIRLWVNDELMQDSSSSNLIFSCAEQIAHLSTRLTLRPGDVIATGTPAGCGAARGRFLKPGDHVTVQVERIGELHNSFIA